MGGEQVGAQKAAGTLGFWAGLRDCHCLCVGGVPNGPPKADGIPCSQDQHPMAAARPLPFPSLPLTLSPPPWDSPGKAALLPVLG